MLEGNFDTAAEPAARRRPGGRPSPRVAQIKRTWYFLRRNTLAMIGLGILVTIVLIALYATTLPISWVAMPSYCATDYGPDNTASGYPGNFSTAGFDCRPYICTYEIVPPPNAANFCGGLWYKTPYHPSGYGLGVSYPSVIAPTDNLAKMNLGPMPLGSLALTIDSSTQFFNLAPGLLRGADWSLIISVSIVGVGATLGMFVGAIAGFWGGTIDDLLMRLVDIFLSIPTILFVIVVISVLSATVHSVTLFGYTLIQALWTPLFTMIIGFAAVWWPFYARLVRGQVLVVREQKYVEAARASGARKGRILIHHIIPNSVYPIFIQFSLDVGTIPLLVGSLVYLGFGPALLPTEYFPEWGTISAFSVVDISSILNSCSLGLCVVPWWQLLFPGLALFLYAVSVNLLSDGLRDALDPRLRR